MPNVLIVSRDQGFFRPFAEVLSRVLSQRGEGSRFKVSFTTPDDRKNFADPSARIYVLDIRPNPEKGLNVAENLIHAHGIEVMLVAGGPQYAMEAWDRDILGYSLFPPDPKKIAGQILRRFPPRTLEAAQFSFRTPSGIRVFSVGQLAYVEYSDHRMLLHTELGETVPTTTIRLSFADAAGKLLEDPRFVRTHASFIVNIMHISRFGQSVLQMDTGDNVPVSHGKRKEVKEHFLRLFGE